jgi:TetR/AcrR family transcriptional repressor of nem operon
MSARDTILEKSYALFVASGYRATTVSDICASAHVTKGAFYHHWESKEALFRDLLMDHYLPHLEQIRDSCARGGESPAAEFLAVFRLMGEAVASLNADISLPGAQFGAYYLLLEGLNYEPSFRDAVASYYEDIVRVVSGIVVRGMTSGAFRSGLDAGAEATAAIAGIEGAGILVMTMRGQSPARLMETLGTLHLEKILAR